VRIVPTIGWALVGDDSTQPLDPRLLPLLAAITRSSSLAGAVAECRISYRGAWGLLRTYGEVLGEPLVLLERGRGASLTAFGQQLVLAERTAARRLETVLPGLAVELTKSTTRSQKVVTLKLRIAASHDLVLASLATGIAQYTPELELEPTFMGSLFALKEFAQGRVDAAGFHVPIDGKAGREPEPFLRLLRARSDRLIRFIDREQGLILPRGNPARVKGFRDIARSGLRFVNRQKGSGTRLLIDRIVGENGIRPEAIAGYSSEEFTHVAVAATVASGGADAGFGLRAAAAEYGLDFVPLARERYYLAVRAKELARPVIAKLVALLRSPAFAQLARRYPGCSAADAGTVVRLDALSDD
jgi:putative molybdopterin biosynthesis protein